MKSRFVALVFTASLASSLAFADNPTDAALLPSDGNTPVVQENAQQKTRAGKHQRYAYKKDEHRALRAKSEDASKGKRQQDEKNGEYPASANY